MGHPLIHLGYAYELSSREIGMEALGLAATCYNDWHKYLDDPSYSKRSAPYKSSSPLEILNRINQDERFDGLFDNPGGDNLEDIFKDHEDVLLEYWNAWEIAEPTKQFEESQKAATGIVVATGGAPYDFFLLHLLTTSHAVRILLPFVPPKFHLAVVKQWWLVTVAIYIAQLRPKIKLETVQDYDLKGRDWKWAENKGVTSKHAKDAHYVKGIRAIKEAAKTWGDHDSFYLKAAVKFADEFGGWGGFGVNQTEY